MLINRHDRPQRYTARLEVRLDAGTQREITRFVTTFRRSRAAVRRHVLEWGLSHARMAGRPPPATRPSPAYLLAAGGRGDGRRRDISAWLRHAVHLVTVADFPARWQAASTAQGRAPPRERESRTDHERFMLRLDDASRGKLDACTRFFVTARADVIRQLITQATPEMFPQSWHLAAAERRQRQANQADTRLGRP